MANICLGIYFNISTWYKITDMTYVGAIISITDIITVIMNVILVPKIGYRGGAWTTLTCYISMVLIGYVTEQNITQYLIITSEYCFI